MIHRLLLASFYLSALSLQAWGTVSEDVEATLSQAHKATPDPMSDQDWSNIAGSRISQTYEIQKGDTLWDISVTFFGNGFYWPKVWQLNGDIPNPHEISPGRVLRFTSGTTAEPPRLTLEKDSGDSAPEDPPAAVADGDDPGGDSGEPNPEEDGPIIPPPPETQQKVLTEIPPSFKAMQSLRSEVKYDVNGFNLEKEPPKPENAKGVASVLVSDEVPAAIGKIREFEAGTEYGQLNQKVFIRSLDISTGDRLSVYNIGEEIKAPSSGEYQGRALLSAGEISVTGKVGTEEDLYEGVITYLVDLMSVNSLLLKGTLPRFDYSFVGKKSQVDGRIVGGEGEQRNRVFGNQNIVFLNVGTQNGVKEGMIFDVHKGYRARGKPDLEQFIHRIGSLKVIRTTQVRSTAVILSTKEPIVAGDRLMRLEPIALKSKVEEDDFDSEERGSVEGSGDEESDFEGSEEEDEEEE